MTVKKSAARAAVHAFGLRLSGIVKERRRSYVPKDNPTTEVVTYTVDDESGRTFLLRDYEPASYFELGEKIDVPVYIRPYQKGNGMSYTINVQKERKGNGERF